MSTNMTEEAKVQRATRNSIPLTIKTYTLPHETELYLEKILGMFLRELGQEKLKDPLAYCLRELAVNAKKANTKRVYFKEKGLDLGNDVQYEEGMTGFKDDTLSNIGHYLQLQKEAGLFIKIMFHAKGRTLHLSVSNNAEITRKEQIRLYDRIARSRAFTSLEEALSTVMDESEGAGLGIVILVLMLKKIGLDEDAFDVDTENGETVARINIPMSDVQVQNLDLLAEAVVREINNLPQFPENIVQLQELISSPDSDIQTIARKISIDVSLTGDLLKLVNSAQFMLPKRVENIAEAVKLVGMRGLQNLLYSYGTQKVLSSSTIDVKWLWEHSYRTAFYAYHLAKRFRRNNDVLDEVYVGGILHDMGKIVFAQVHPQLLEQISRFCHEKGIPSKLFEDLAAGLDHATIGAKIAEKWNFPEALVTAIKYHHEPKAAPPYFKDVVYTVHFANVLCHLQDEDHPVDSIDREVLEYFGIQSEEKLIRLRQQLDKLFDRETAAIR